MTSHKGHKTIEQGLLHILHQYSNSCLSDMPFNTKFCYRGWYPFVLGNSGAQHQVSSRRVLGRAKSSRLEEAEERHILIESPRSYALVGDENTRMVSWSLYSLTFCRLSHHCGSMCCDIMRNQGVRVTSPRSWSSDDKKEHIRKFSLFFSFSSFLVSSLTK